MKKFFKIIWIILALVVLVGGLIFSLKYEGGTNWKVWVIWGAACAVLNIFKVLVSFFSKFRGCLGTISFLAVSIILAPLYVAFNIIANFISLFKSDD